MSTQFCRYLAVIRCNVQLPELGLYLPLVSVQGDGEIAVEVACTSQTPIRLIYGVYQIPNDYEHEYVSSVSDMFWMPWRRAWFTGGVGKSVVDCLKPSCNQLL